MIQSVPIGFEPGFIRSMEKQNSLLSKFGIGIATILSASAYVWMEWLFLVTKPSFMNVVSWPRRTQILLFTAVWAVLCAIILVLVLGLLGRTKIVRQVLPKDFVLPLLVPAGFLAILFFLWQDNFTYTVFRFGVATSAGVGRVAYGALLLFFMFPGYRISREVAAWFSARKSLFYRSRWVMAAAGVCILVWAGIPIVQKQLAPEALSEVSADQKLRKPDIYLITSDGLSADHLSAYGYERDTSPNLRALADSSFFAQNAFSNAANTSGSLVSIYTGRYPAETRVLYPPNILTGGMAFQHLPGILRLNGYHTVQISNPYYGDAYTLNVQEGFDEANDRSMLFSTLMPEITRLIPDDFSFFVYEIANRSIDRVRHVWLIKKMQNPFDFVLQDAAKFSDDNRYFELLDQVESVNTPLFVHVHFMATHGRRYQPQTQFYSQGIPNKPFDPNYYDDVIREFDQQVGQFVARLSQSGKLEQSILIIGSDHGQQWSVKDRIPLMIRFPNGEYAGKTDVPVQNLDLAPTLLDYIGIPVPDWMEGNSLIQQPLLRRPIIAAEVSSRIADENLVYAIDESKLKPPFYNIGIITVGDCQNWYALNLYTLTWETGQYAGYVSPCSDDQLLPADAILPLIDNHLSRYGFDTRPLKNLSPPQPLD